MPAEGRTKKAAGPREERVETSLHVRVKGTWLLTFVAINLSTLPWHG
jgi:hypothetical protein